MHHKTKPICEVRHVEEDGSQLPCKPYRNKTPMILMYHISLCEIQRFDSKVCPARPLIIEGRYIVPVRSVFVTCAIRRMFARF